MNNTTARPEPRHRKIRSIGFGLYVDYSSKINGLNDLLTQLAQDSAINRALWLTTHYTNLDSLFPTYSIQIATEQGFQDTPATFVPLSYDTCANILIDINSRYFGHSIERMANIIASAMSATVRKEAQA